VFYVPSYKLLILDNHYKEIHEDLKEASKTYTLIEGILEVHKSDEGHYIIKNPEPYISFGLGDIDILTEDIINNEIEDDDDDWYEGMPILRGEKIKKILND